MTTNSKTKQLFKILIGAAWIDGKIQAGEREYLHKMVKENALAEDNEIKMFLSEIKPVEAQECYEWLEEYLGENPTQEDYQKLLESLSGLIYSDNDVEIEEAKLLAHLQTLEPPHDSQKSAFDKLLKSIQKLYRKAVQDQVN